MGTICKAIGHIAGKKRTENAADYDVDFSSERTIQLYNVYGSCVLSIILHVRCFVDMFHTGVSDRIEELSLLPAVIFTLQLFFNIPN